MVRLAGAGRIDRFRFENRLGDFARLEVTLTELKKITIASVLLFSFPHLFRMEAGLVQFADSAAEGEAKSNLTEEQERALKKKEQERRRRENKKNKQQKPKATTDNMDDNDGTHTCIYVTFEIFSICMFYTYVSMYRYLIQLNVLAHKWQYLCVIVWYVYDCSRRDSETGEEVGGQGQPEEESD